MLFWITKPSYASIISRKEREAKEKKNKEEQSLDDEDLYEGFDRYGNRIA